jgi:glycerol kinase
MNFILAIDQGTSSTKTVIFDENSKPVFKGHVDLHTDYFDNGFVEQNPDDIYQNVLDSVSKCLQNFTAAGHEISEIASCGISNQRETFILWDKEGNYLAPAIVWACKRSVTICQRLIAEGKNDVIKEKTGLIIDPYFSATKLLWLLENDANLKNKLEQAEVYFGTVDTWILYKMTKGKSFKTDFTNAHRTLLFNINTLMWDHDILKMWGLENLNLPEVYASSVDFGTWNLSEAFPNSSFIIPNTSPLHDSSLNIHHSPLNIHNSSFALPNYSLKITALIGDSHAAAFGEACFEAGTAKVTLGTGSSIMMNIGEKPVISKAGMLTTICWSTENTVAYALEGAIVACGSSIEWIKNELGFFKEVSETEAMANAVNDNGGLYLIPAFSGLGAPHWQMDRKASIEGMTFGTTKNHIVRAALESIPYQIKDVVNAMGADMGGDLKSIAVNGGLTQNQFVMRFLVDLLGIPLHKQSDADISALGAAYLSGLKSGVYTSLEHLKELNRIRTEKIEPNLNNSIIQDFYAKWIEIIKSK